MIFRSKRKKPGRWTNWRMSRSAAETIRQPRDRLKGQPQERQHSAAVGGTRDRPPPARGTIISCARDRSPKGRDPTSRVRYLRGSARESPGRQRRTRPPPGMLGNFHRSTYAKNVPMCGDKDWLACKLLIDNLTRGYAMRLFGSS